MGEARSKPTPTATNFHGKGSRLRLCTRRRPTTGVRGRAPVRWPSSEPLWRACTASNWSTAGDTAAAARRRSQRLPRATRSSRRSSKPRGPVRLRARRSPSGDGGTTSTCSCRSRRGGPRRHSPVWANRSVSERLNFTTTPCMSGGTSKHASKVRGRLGFRVSAIPSVLTAIAHCCEGS